MIRRNSKVTMELLYNINISKGVFTHPYISLLKLKEDNTESYMLLQHKKGKYPPKNDLSKGVCIHEDFIGRRYNSKDIEPLLKTFQSWEENKSGTLMSYTYLYAYCKALGKDLHKDYNIM